MLWLIEKNVFDQAIKSYKKALHADPKAIQQINSTENLSGKDSRLTFFIIEEAKKIILYFEQGTFKVFWMCSTTLLQEQYKMT